MLRPSLSLLLASSLVLTSTRPAFAAPAVQPVPYKASQPVPYAVESPPPSSAAPAPPPGPGVVVGAVGNDVVYLKDGGMIRGTLVETIPKDHATVHLSTGQNAIIPWKLIDHIEAGAPPLPSPATTRPAASSATNGALVHIESAEPVTLQFHDGTGMWTFACSSPCDREVPIDAQYRIVGPGMRNTAPFNLQARPGDRVELTVSPASQGGFVGGIVMVSVGPVVAIVGLFVILAGAIEGSSTSTCNWVGTGGGTGCTSSSDGSGTERVGGYIALGGLALLVGGIVLVVANARSGVSQSAAEPRRDAWLRAPTWREDPMGAGMPKAASAPLFSTSF